MNYDASLYCILILKMNFESLLLIFRATRYLGYVTHDEESMGTGSTAEHTPDVVIRGGKVVSEGVVGGGGPGGDDAPPGHAMAKKGKVQGHDPNVRALGGGGEE